jgi:hypothetical protein
VQSPNKEAILGILDELDTMYGAISNDPDPGLMRKYDVY